MSNNPYHQDMETVPICSDFLKKFKRLRLFEPSLGVLGFFLVTVCVLCCFFYLDYSAVATRFRISTESEEFVLLKFNGSVEDRRVEFLSEKGGGCDVFDGDWVWDETYPLYQSKDCRFLDEGFRCDENGRPDLFYTKWRWQPKDWVVTSKEGAEVKMEMKVDSAYRKSLDTVIDWIHREVYTSKTQVFFRTYSPVHFRGGDWRTGGSCHLETLPELGSSLVPPQTCARYSIFLDVLSSLSNTSKLETLDILNVTIMSSQRKDGHSSLYYLGPKVGPAPLHRQDCSHWCLPGVPNAWNELLYTLFLKRETVRMWNSSTFLAPS
ncbi:Protein trichome birefringence-like 10 [Camellia lanceoleosa]|uniref:Protein trichome birefringence-like 10 n=1 Tax=Camellia lanceoleosa TaxID=1840588 RepID=A0ACC0HEC0_9ERIC|nr:Protein trichome birefringence-like 10 [Camellia lanceoleosa]